MHLRIHNGCIQSVDWTGGLDYWTDRFSFKTHIWRLYNEVQWREIAPTVETLGHSWFYYPRLSTTPTIVAQSTGKNETEFQVIVRLVASASTETVYLLIPVAVSALSPELPPPSTSCSIMCWVARHRLETLGKLPSLSCYPICRSIICNLHALYSR